MLIEDLLENYRNAFDSFNAEAIAKCYHLPCSTSDGDGCLVFTNQASLIAKCSENLETMKSIGYTSSKFNVLSQNKMDDFSQSVTVGWRIETVGQILEFRCLYIFRSTKKGWKIFSANVYEGSLK